MKKINLQQKSRDIAKKLIAIRRDLHEHPELSFKELRTAGIIAATLRNLGIEVKENVGQTGVTGFLQGGKPGPDAGYKVPIPRRALSPLGGVAFLLKSYLPRCG